ncbi:MAG: ATP-binding protein [Candidatus Omnitrophota bacterium]
MINLGRSGSLRNSKSGNKTIILKVPSEIKQIKKVSSGILDSLASQNIDEAALFDIRLCVEEAVRNAIVHGNHCDKRLSVTVSYWIEEGSFIIEVEDEGKGFDHKYLPDPTDEGNMLRNHGRGVYLIKRLMNEVQYNDTGNKVRMVKRIEQ